MSSYPFQGRVGSQSASDGSYQPFSVGRDGALITSDVHGKYYGAVARGSVFTLGCGLTSTTIAAGNLLGAAAAAATQFAIWNPVGSGKNFSILEYGYIPTSGTPTGGGVWAGFLSVALGDTLPTISSLGSAADASPKNCLHGSAVTSSAGYLSTLASSGTVLTGATAVRRGKALNFAFTANALANIGSANAVDQIDGKIVLAPGSLFLPLFAGAGTTMIGYHTLTWEEVPA